MRDKLSLAEGPLPSTIADFVNDVTSHLWCNRVTIEVEYSDIPLCDEPLVEGCTVTVHVPHLNSESASLAQERADVWGVKLTDDGSTFTFAL